MALTRKFLAALGVEADKIDEIISAHAETVSALKGEIEKESALAKQYKDDAEKYASTKEELDSLKAEYGDKNYDELKSEYDQFKAEVQAKEAQAAKEKAFREAIKDANLTERGIEKAVKYADWDKIELDEDGKLKDAKDHVKAVREDWAEYISKVEKKGAQTATPPGGAGGETHTPSRAAMIAKRHYEAIYGKGENE